jgi:hypothetical protein
MAHMAHRQLLRNFGASVREIATLPANGVRAALQSTVLAAYEIADMVAHAAELGRLNVVRIGVTHLERNSSGDWVLNTAVRAATKAGRVSIVQYFLKHFGFAAATVVQTAMSSCDSTGTFMAMVRCLVDAGFPPNPATVGVWLKWLATRGDVVSCRFLFELPGVTSAVMADTLRCVTKPCDAYVLAQCPGAVQGMHSLDRMAPQKAPPRGASGPRPYGSHPYVACGPCGPYGPNVPLADVLLE